MAEDGSSGELDTYVETIYGNDPDRPRPQSSTSSAGERSSSGGRSSLARSSTEHSSSSSGKRFPGGHLGDIDLEAGRRSSLEGDEGLEPRWPDRATRAPKKSPVETTETVGGLRVTVPSARGEESEEAADSPRRSSRTNGLLKSALEQHRLKAFEVERFLKFKVVAQACVSLALVANNFVILRAAYEQEDDMGFRAALTSVLWISVGVNCLLGIFLLAQLVLPLRRRQVGVPSKEWNLWSPNTWQAKEDTIFHWQRKFNSIGTILSFVVTILNLFATAFAPQQFILQRMN